MSPLRVGDRVRTKDGRLGTVRALHFSVAEVQWDGQQVAVIVGLAYVTRVSA